MMAPSLFEGLCAKGLEPCMTFRFATGGTYRLNVHTARFGPRKRRCLVQAKAAKAKGTRGAMLPFAMMTALFISLRAGLPLASNG